MREAVFQQVLNDKRPCVQALRGSAIETQVSTTASVILLTMRRFLILWHIIVLPLLAEAQNCGIPDTILIGTNRTVTYNFDVTDVVNDNLADPAQGICGIEIEFLHQFSEKLELWLRSPSGQEVQLIGPNTTDPLAFTFGARWNINFVPCAAVARPDSGYVARWNNDQPRNFVSGGRYSGSYYPHDGCLEDFNTGPVNGQWTIIVRNNPSVYQGAILRFRLRLCDERGFLCCFANAGSLASYPDVTACESSDALRLNIPPVYNVLPPENTEYAYTYMISQNNVLLAYDSIPDLRGYAPGTYRVCGLSYRIADRDSLPVPDGSVLLSVLRQQLNDNVLLYCGNVTTNCVDVTITPPGDTTFLSETICRGETFQVGSSVFDTEGQYDVLIPVINGCDEVVRLTLTVVDPVITTLNQTICAGESFQVGNSIYTTSGTYTDRLRGSNSCDSIVNLTLIVRPLITTNISAAICNGDSYTIDNQAFTTSGMYQAILRSTEGCDSTVNLTLSVLNPEARIAAPASLDCDNLTVTLDGSASTPAGQLDFQWLDSNANPLGNNPTLDVSTPGQYILQIAQTEAGTVCLHRDTILIEQTRQNAPIANIAPPAVIGCNTPTITLDATASSQRAGLSYQWSGPGITSGGNTLNPIVNEPGTYLLMVSNANGSCIDSASVNVAKDTALPTANAGNGFLLTCADTIVTIGGSNTSTGANITYQWLTQGGNFVGATNQRTAVVDAPGTYTLVVTDLSSGCADTALTTVARDVTPPTADAGPPAMITCAVPDAVLDGSNSSQGGNMRYQWSNAGGQIIGTNSVEIVTQPGRYFLQVLNITNSCAALDSVDISIETGVPTITFGNSLITCDSGALTLQPIITPPVGNYSYVWSGPSILTPVTQRDIRVNAPGNYVLNVRNIDNDCTVSDTVRVVLQDCDICLQTLPPDTLTCLNDVIALEAVLCAACDNCTIVWTTADGNIVSGANSLTPEINVPGTYTVTVTNSTNFSVVANVLVLQNTETPQADAGPDLNITCNQPIVTIGGSNMSTGPDFAHIWMTRSGTPVIPNNSPMINVTWPDTFYLEVLNTITGCIATDSVVVGLDPLPPLADAGASQALTCNQPTATLNGTASSAGADIAYNWTTADGNILSGNTTTAPTINAAGVYLLTVTNTRNGCQATASVVVDADELPVIPAIADTALTCTHEAIVLTANFSSNGGNFRLQWCQLDANDNPLNCADGLQIPVSAPGRYRFAVTNEDNGCAASRLVTVAENRLPPMVDAGPNDTLSCLQTDQRLQGTAMPSNGNYDYRWTARNNSPIQDATTLTPTIAQADTYILLVTNRDNGCSATDSLQILLNEATPIVFAGFDTLLNCLVTNIRLEPQVIGNNLRYQWTTPDGNITSGSDTPNPVVSAPGAYILMATDTNSGCSAQDTLVVGQNTFPPTAVIADAASLNCTNDIVSLDARNSLSQTGASLTFRWRAISGALAGDLTQALIQTTTGGTYEVTVMDSQNGCTGTATITIDADYKRPEVGTRPIEPLTCVRTETVIDAGISSAGNNFTVQWTAPNGTILPQTGLQLNVAQAGAYGLRMTNRDNGCSDSILVNIPVNTEPPGISIAPPVALDCEVTTTQLVATVSGGSSFTFNWTTADGNILSGQTNSIATIGRSGTYTLAVVRADNGCVSQSSIFVDAIEIPIEQGFVSVIRPNCIERGSASVIIDSVQGGTGPYLYSLFDSPFTPDPVFANLATGAYNLVIQDRNGCEWRTQVTIPTPDTIAVSLGEDIEIDLGDSTLLRAMLSTPDFRSIIWKPAETNDTLALELMVKPVRSTRYQVAVTGLNGCVGEAGITVFVNEKTAVFAPNVFSPNGDGVNDVFMLFAGQTVARIKSFMIFDRWGNRVYEAGPFQPNDPNFGWDGTWNGQPMDAGVFVFFAEVELIDDQVKVVKGDVTLVR